MESSVPQLLPLLKQYFGFTSFRPVAGGDHPRRAGGQGRVRAAADGRRQVALLPVAGDGAGGADGGGVAADRADEGPGGCVAGQRRAGHVPQLLAGGGRIAGAAARAAYRAVSAALRRAGAADALGVPGRFAAVGGEPAGGGRGALHQRMGARFPARIPPARRAAPAVPDGADDGADRDGDRARAQGHRRAAEAARAELLRRQLQPPEPDLPGVRQEQALPAGAGVPARAAQGKRHRLLPVAQDHRERRRAAECGRRQGPALPRRADAKRAHASTRSFSCATRCG